MVQVMAFMMTRSPIRDMSIRALKATDVSRIAVRVSQRSMVIVVLTLDPQSASCLVNDSKPLFRIDPDDSPLCPDFPRSLKETIFLYALVSESIFVYLILFTQTKELLPDPLDILVE